MNPSVLSQLKCDPVALVALTRHLWESSTPRPVEPPTAKRTRNGKRGLNSGAKRVLTRHYSRDTLPTFGDIRFDKYRFFSTSKKTDGEGKTYWNEIWCSPEYFARRYPSFDRNKAKKAAKAVGFTLIELLAVIAILAIVACVLVPSVARAWHHARANIENARQFHADRLSMAWDGDATNEIFSVHNYNEMAQEGQIP